MDVQNPGNAENLLFHERSRYRAAAHHVRRVLPGLLGELVSRELTAYAEFGYRFTTDGLIPRLAAEILATPAAEHAQPPFASAQRLRWAAGPQARAG